MPGSQCEKTACSLSPEAATSIDMRTLQMLLAASKDIMKLVMGDKETGSGKYVLSTEVEGDP